MRTTGGCAAALSTLVFACGGTSSSEASASTPKLIEVEALDLGSGDFEVRVLARNLAAQRISGIALQIDFPGLHASHLAQTSAIGPFLANGELAAAFRNDAPESLAMGAALHPSAAPRPSTPRK